ncbi:MAG: hypothetical protein HY951_10685 [Bacteroidia bacterium]|nr:hypothetical protein [Bacteroidia bacterium]
MENHGLFERYLDGSMSETEKTDFLKQLSTDKVLEKEFALYNEVNNVIYDYNKRADFKEALNNAESRYFYSMAPEKNIEKSKNNRFFIYKIAASVALIVSISVFGYYIFYSKQSNKELYAQYYKPLNIDAISRSADDSLLNIEKGFIAYQNGKYDESIKLLSHENSSSNILVNLVKGLSYMELGNFTMAESLLLDASKDETNGMHEDCLWYLSLTYIQLNKPEKAIPVLQKLIDNKSVYVKEAEKLIKKIE